MLSVLSFGGGQDSTALLYMYLYDRAFRERYAPGEFLVAMSDTQAEHPDTIEHVAECRDLCESHSIPFLWITADLGFHTGHWRDGGLLGQWRATSTITSVAFPNASCTDSLKIAPFYKALNHVVACVHGYAEEPRKAALRSYAADHDKINVWIGFTRGEEARAGIARSLQQAFDFACIGSSDPLWMQESIAKQYPLIDLGLDRRDCQNAIKGFGHRVPPPSQCYACHWKSDEMVLWTKLRYPELFNAWSTAERQKLNDWNDEAFRRARQKPENFIPNGTYKNTPVGGRFHPDGRPIALEERAEVMQRALGHLSATELLRYLDAYRMDHGHAVGSQF
ncbi:MAG TPA: hypothetical protein VNF68_07905 [Candidatus Baltobacteraceae bacterium]|nr:hypothetical protein [Candidatus Baltobacteraceae bacterium]